MNQSTSNTTPPSSKVNAEPFDIVMCVESGYFERQAKLLLYSIRTAGEEYHNCPVYIYQGRAKYPVSRESRAFFEQYGAHFISTSLNTKFTHYTFANKPLVCAHHEQHSSAKCLVYMDCDMMVYQAPKLFGSLGPNQIQIRPEDARGYGTAHDFKDENGPIWEAVYQAYSIAPAPAVHTIHDYALVQPYYNAGHFQVHRSAGFCQQWLDNFKRLLKEKMLPKRTFILAEQMAFSFTVTQMELAVVPMGVSYNFPLNLWAFDEIKHPEYQKVDFEELATLHYHKIFARGTNPAMPWLEKTERGRDLAAKIEEFGLLESAKLSWQDKIKRRYDNRLAHWKYSH